MTSPILISNFITEMSLDPKFIPLSESVKLAHISAGIQDLINALDENDVTEIIGSSLESAVIPPATLNIRSGSFTANILGQLVAFSSPISGSYQLFVWGKNGVAVQYDDPSNGISTADANGFTGFSAVDSTPAGYIAIPNA